jgi:hypothetical protein
MLSVHFQRPPQSQGQWFTSAKCRGPIRITRPAVLDFCVVSTIDPAVRALSPAEPVEVPFEGSTVTHRPDVAVLRSEGLCLVDVNPKAPSKPFFEALKRAVAQQGHRYQWRDAAASLGLINRSWMVWGCGHVEVGPGDQVRVLDLIDRSGGQARLRDAETAIRHCADRRAAVFSLVSHGVLEIDVLFGLTDDTPVRRHPRS